MQNNIMLGQGPDFWCWFDTTQFSYIPLCSPNTCKYVFNPSNCAEGLHFSAFIINPRRACAGGLRFIIVYSNSGVSFDRTSLVMVFPLTWNFTCDDVSFDMVLHL